MKSFYKKWLDKNRKENEEVNSNVPISEDPVQSTSNLAISHQPVQSTSKASSFVATNVVQPSTISALPNINSQTDILYEDQYLKMIVEKGAFQRQKRFRFQDHLFFVKILLKDEEQPVPFLQDILEFIQLGLLHLMKSIKQFYNEKDENICYLTLHQNPMVIGLNSGNTGLIN